MATVTKTTGRHIRNSSDSEERVGLDTVHRWSYFDLDQVYITTVMMGGGVVTKTVDHRVDLSKGKSINVDSSKGTTHGDGTYGNLMLDRGTTSIKGPDGSVDNSADSRLDLSTGWYTHDPNGTGDSHHASIQVVNGANYRAVPGSYRWTGEHQASLNTSDSTNSRDGDTYTSAGRSYNVSATTGSNSYASAGKSGSYSSGSTRSSAGTSFSDYESTAGNRNWTNTYSNGGVRVEKSDGYWQQKESGNSGRGTWSSNSTTVHAGGSKSVSNSEGSLSSGHYFELRVSDDKGSSAYTGSYAGSSRYLNHNVVVRMQDYTSSYKNDGSSEYDGRTVELRLNTFTDWNGAGKVSNTTYSATLTIRTEHHDRDANGVPTDSSSSASIEIKPSMLGEFLPLNFLARFKAVGPELDKFGGDKSVNLVGGILRGELGGMQQELGADFNWARATTGSGLIELRSVPATTHAAFLTAEHVALPMLEVSRPMLG